jgi:hypothetical protein
MAEINEINNEINQESNFKKEWIKPKLEFMEIEGGQPSANEGSTAFVISI